MNLALADALDVPRRHDIEIRWSEGDAARVASLLSAIEAGEPYAALHVHPKFNYKMWHVDGWVGLAQWLRKRGIVTVLTGGSEATEVEFAAAVAAQMPAGTVNLAGQLTLAQSACVIAGARVYVGPDTLTTHMAGRDRRSHGRSVWPVEPGEMGTVAKGFRRHHFALAARRQPGDAQRPPGPGGRCVRACMHEGCDQHVASFSDCLRQLPLPTVTAAVERALVAHGS
jgi:heptosyltransferase-3